MKLLASGDWHLGAGSDYGRRPGDRLRDQRDVAMRIADLAIDEGVDGVLLAGDLLEGPAATPEQLEVLAEFVASLQGRIPVLAITGNSRHDLAVRETTGLAVFNHIPGIEVHSQPGWVAFAGCAVVVLPWVSPARLVAARGGGDRDEINAEVAELLVHIAGDLLAEMPTDRPRLLLGHWPVSGSSLPNGLPVDQLREPVIPLGELEQLAFDATVLGHIHAPQMLGNGAAAPLLDPNAIQLHDRLGALYVGSPMPLNFGEAHTAHGVWVIDLGASTTEFHPIASRPFVTHDLDLTTHEGIFALSSLDPVPDGAIVRVRYRATAAQARDLDIAAWRRELQEQGAHVVKIVPDIVRADRARVTDVERPDEISEEEWLNRWLDEMGTSAGAAVDVRAALAELQDTSA